ncbi:hypothetical protein ES705_47389 [subsurface metagenome]
MPGIVLRGDSEEELLVAKDYIYKKHEEWISGLEEWRKNRMEQILRKTRK